MISPETIGLSPLAGAVFRQNKKMVDIVYKAYQTLCNTYRTPGWDVQKVRSSSFCRFFWPCLALKLSSTGELTKRMVLPPDVSIQCRVSSDFS